MDGALGAQMEDSVRFTLNQQEYEEFLRWFKKVYLKERDQKKAPLDLSNLKRDTWMNMEEDGLCIRAGRTELKVLYSALSGPERSGSLILFFAQKEFWAIPQRALGSSEKAEDWFRRLRRRRGERGRGDDGGSGNAGHRIPLEAVAEACTKEGIPFYYYTRTVDQLSECFRALGWRNHKIQQLRKLSLFPYRYVGIQVLALKEDGLYEYGERSISRHAYADLEQVFYTRKCLYLFKKGGEKILIPMEILGGAKGMDELVRLCNERRRADLAPLCPGKMAEPLKLGNKGKRCLGVAAACLILGVTLWGLKSAIGERPTAFETAGEGGFMVTVPDETIFDQVGEDGSFVSSNQFYRLTLPPGEWKVKGSFDGMDYLESQWGTVRVWGSRDMDGYVMMGGPDIPRTKEDYIRSMTKYQIGIAGDLPEVVEYTYREEGEIKVVQKEVRYMDHFREDLDSENSQEEGDTRYSLELALTAPRYYYTVGISPKEETPQAIEEARRTLDSFRMLDTSAGICREMEKDTFYGYYGKNTVMTSCLVLLEHPMSAEEIGDCLELIEKTTQKHLLPGSGETRGHTLAARREGSRWLGIDCYGLQQNCTGENAKRVSKIFKADVILYDEFDGDLLMIAYSDKEQKHVYQRATAADPEILEREFGCFGKEQEFPEDLLKYMDLTREEADAIWKDPEAVFQMDKWYRLAGHMTREPVPEELMGMCGYRAIRERFEVIRR